MTSKITLSLCSSLILKYCPQCPFPPLETKRSLTLSNSPESHLSSSRRFAVTASADSQVFFFLMDAVASLFGL